MASENSQASLKLDEDEGELVTEAHTDEEENSGAVDAEETKNSNIGNEPDKDTQIAALDETDVESDEKASESVDVKKKKTHALVKKALPQLSNRLEYLARPRKDFLDSKAHERLDGAIPENAYPLWSILPLQNKIPFAECPMPVTRTQLGANLFLPPPANDFDLFDENNLQLPSERYDNMHDPNLKQYVRNKNVLQHLTEEGFVTESGKATCSLKDIHVFRRYQRRIQAAEAQKNLRDEDEEFRKKRAEGMERKIKRDMQKYHKRRSQGMMRCWIKNTVASIQESSMNNQMIRDMKVLNSQITRQRKEKRRVEASQERYDRLYSEHIKKKYADAEKRRRETHLDFAKKDLGRLEKLCKRQEEEKSQRKEKLKEFWMRKLDWMEEWIKKGQELEDIREKERQRNIDLINRSRGSYVSRLRKENDSRKKTPSKSQKASKMSLSDVEEDDAENAEAKQQDSAAVEEIKVNSEIGETTSDNSPEKSSLKSSEPETEDISKTSETNREETEDARGETKTTEPDDETY